MAFKEIDLVIEFVNNIDRLQKNGVVILILSTSHSSYASFKDSIRETWLKNFESCGITCLFYEGGAEATHLSGDTIKLPCDDGLHFCAEKLRLALEFILKLKPNFKAVYRTNLSSYIDVDQFNLFVQKMGLSESTYVGIRGRAKILPEYFYRNRNIKYVLDKLHIGPSVSFASGAGMFIGRRNCLRIVEKRKYDRFVDDVMVGMCLREYSKVTHEPDRFDFTLGFDPRCDQVEFSRRVKAGLFHYRFKSNDRDNDAALIKSFGDRKFRLDYCTH